MKISKFVVGIDEVGRGPIAGPVCVGAFRINHESVKNKIKKTGIPLRDSKKLTSLQRENWLKYLRVWKREGLVDFHISYVHAVSIDKYGIAPSISRALERSLYRMKPEIKNSVLLDGGLRAPKEFKKQKTIIKGDTKEPLIMLASIVAKFYRDRLMKRHAKIYPEYGFQNHVGYGTKAHYKAIKKHGLSPLHRRSFLKNIS